MRTVLIGAAGFLGAVTRYHVGGLVSRRPAGSAFPWGTLIVNLSGCFAVGVLATVLTERFMPDPRLRSAVLIGFLSAYTTFSTFAYESFRLGEEGARGLAALNVVASVGLGLVAVWAGIAMGRTL